MPPDRKCNERERKIANSPAEVHESSKTKLGQERLRHFAIFDDFHRPRAGHQRLLVINAEQLIDGAA